MISPNANVSHKIMFLSPKGAWKRKCENSCPEPTHSREKCLVPSLAWPNQEQVGPALYNLASRIQQLTLKRFEGLALRGLERRFKESPCRLGCECSKTAAESRSERWAAPAAEAAARLSTTAPGTTSTCRTTRTWPARSSTRPVSSEWDIGSAETVVAVKSGVFQPVSSPRRRRKLPSSHS